MHCGNVGSERTMHSNASSAAIQLYSLVYSIHDLGLRNTCEEANEILIGNIYGLHLDFSQDLEYLQRCVDSKLYVLIYF